MELNQLKKELKRYQFEYNENVLLVHTDTYVFLFGFTEKGISLFPLNAEDRIEETALLPWSEILSFKVKKGIFSESIMQIEAKKMTFSMKINRAKGENAWIKSNLQKLERYNYYQNMTFSFGQMKSAEEIAEIIYQKLTAYTAKKLVAFDISEEDAGIFDCKIGGAYYVPAEAHIPTNSATGEAMYLLAQVNFAQIPHLEGYPEKGLMQILISSQETYGCSLEDPYNQAGWCIRYFETLPEKADKSFIYQPEWRQNTELPMQSNVTYRLKPYEVVQTMSFDDENFWTAAEACLSPDLKRCLEENDDIMDSLCEFFEEYPCQVGGYPHFTQSDPRNGCNDEILLFQLDSVKDIMWGDDGVANFFIERKDLEHKDFSHVMYNWDCY